MRPQLSDLTNNQVEEQTQQAVEYHNAMMCTRLAGRAIIRVVGRCNDAQENENLVAQFEVILTKAFSATMASGVTRVIQRCENAQESEILDLSDCQLMQVPDAVFHLMRHTNLKICDLSFNVIAKIPPKLASKFSGITELNVSNNRMSKLPDELGELQELTKLDISHNAFVSVPRITYTLPKLEHVNAEKNYIADVDTKRLGEHSSLKVANFRQNPLTKDCHEALSTVTSMTILISPRIDDEWEKLDSEF